MTWEELKEQGSGRYKGSNDIEPIDLFRSGRMLRSHCITAIIKYAYRNRADCGPHISASDMNKIKHYTDILIYLSEHGEGIDDT